ncbi:hypothetical protein Tsubulata_025957 [Turnera subulata]|uniref:tRNA-intron lyase n=1 Tax=Turnera subulata TaxID=218843 RepID=A0A9Q0JDQ0_9ROSI|nr:hypothetical protein Tsubulata_025957 [Turnera subulata]
MGPRWKGKGSKAKALADPMSSIVSLLQSSLIQSDARGFFSGCYVHLAVEEQQVELLHRACFGLPILNVDKDKKWFQLELEEAFFLCYNLHCLKIVGQDNCVKNDLEIWEHMKSKKQNFPDLYKGYSHLRTKNWVVRPGSQYGVDYVAYRHHPSLVHSEYTVLVLSEGEGENVNGRLRVWSDIYCTVRLSGGVAKTLLVLYINKNGHGVVLPSCLQKYSVEERTITRFNLEQKREEDQITTDHTTS